MKKPLSYILGLPLSKIILDVDEVKTLTRTTINNRLELIITGMENIPSTGPGIIASNHESYLDILLLGSNVEKRYIHFVAKKELFESEKIYGQWLKNQIEECYAMPIDRENPTAGQIKEFMQRLSQGHVLSIFPEGTRKKPVPLIDFHNLVAMLSYGKNIPVIPTGIIGTRYAEKHLFDGTFPKVEINFGEPIYCKKINGEYKKDTLNDFSRKLKNEVASLMRLDPFPVYHFRSS